MDPRVQRRVQRYGWDLAAPLYESLWRGQLSPAHVGLLQMAPPLAGQAVIDSACGTGLVTLAAALAVGAQGRVVGTDISGLMIDAARRQASEAGLRHVHFERMDAESLDLPDADFDLAYCALGLMYMPDPAAAMRELHRVLRRGGRVAVAVWGERSRCGWSGVFPIVDAEVSSDVCPLFFQLGNEGALAQLCTEAGFVDACEVRIQVGLEYADADAACDAALVGGPVAMAWSRFDEETRRRVRRRYLDDIARFGDGDGYRIPGEFVLMVASKEGQR